MARAKDKGAKNGNGGMSGVEYENGEPVYIEEIPEAELHVMGKVLADKCLELENLESNWRIESAKHRGDVKDVKADIRTLREQVQTGTRKRPAQKTLPNTGADA